MGIFLLLGLFDNKFMHVNYDYQRLNDRLNDRLNERKKTRRWSFQCSFLSTTAIRGSGNAFRPTEISAKTKLVPRPITKTRVERLEVKNYLRSKWRVFVATLGEKLLQNNQFLRNFCL